MVSGGRGKFLFTGRLCVGTGWIFLFPRTSNSFQEKRGAVFTILSVRYFFCFTAVKLHWRSNYAAPGRSSDTVPGSWRNFKQVCINSNLLKCNHLFILRQNQPVQYTGFWHRCWTVWISQRSEYHTDIKNFAGYSHEKYRKVVCITICFTFVQKHSEYTLIIGKVNSWYSFCSVKTQVFFTEDW